MGESLAQKCYDLCPLDAFFATYKCLTSFDNYKAYPINNLMHISSSSNVFNFCGFKIGSAVLSSQTLKKETMAEYSVLFTVP